MTDKKSEQFLQQWDSFCEQLKSSGRELLEQAQNLDAVTQADGLRYLTRLLRGGIEKFVEYNDPSDPIIYKVYHEKLKWGGDNPDSIYSMSSIDGHHEYRISGNRGTINYFNFSSMKMDTDGKLKLTGFIDCQQLIADSEGNFNIILSKNRPSETPLSNWLPLENDSNTIMIRQTFIDRSKETELTATIHPLAPIKTSKALQPEQILSGLNKAESFFANTGKTFSLLSQAMYNTVNQLPAVDEDYIKSMGGDPNYSYFWSAYQLKPGQALLVHLPKEPVCDTWSLCLHNYWLESLDYHKSQIILNKYTAQKNPDGSVTMAISMEDPGINNWLDSCDHPLGQMIFRWTKTEEVIAPQVELVDLKTTNWKEKQKRWI